MFFPPCLSCTQHISNYVCAVCLAFPLPILFDVIFHSVLRSRLALCSQSVNSYGKSNLFLYRTAFFRYDQLSLDTGCHVPPSILVQFSCQCPLRRDVTFPRRLPVTDTGCLCIGLHSPVGTIILLLFACTGNTYTTYCGVNGKQPQDVVVCYLRRGKNAKKSQE